METATWKLILRVTSGSDPLTELRAIQLTMAEIKNRYNDGDRGKSWFALSPPPAAPTPIILPPSSHPGAASGSTNDVTTNDDGSLPISQHQVSNQGGQPNERPTTPHQRSQSPIGARLSPSAVDEADGGDSRAGQENGLGDGNASEVPGHEADPDDNRARSSSRPRSVGPSNDVDMHGPDSDADRTSDQDRRSEPPLKPADPKKRKSETPTPQEGLRKSQRKKNAPPPNTTTSSRPSGSPRKPKAGKNSKGKGKGKGKQKESAEYDVPSFTDSIMKVFGVQVRDRQTWEINLLTLCHRLR